MELKFTPEYKNILERSRDEAIRHNSQEIEPIHLFLALTSDSSSKSYRLIESASTNYSIPQLRNEIDSVAHCNSNLTEENIITSPLAERIIKLSTLEARMLKSEYVDAEHLLLALFHNSETQNMDFLKTFINIGINYDSL